MDRVSDIDIDVWLQDSIMEYLRFSAFEHTAECMVSERYTMMENGKLMLGDKAAVGDGVQVRDVIRGRFMESFVEGDQERFLSLWSQHIPKEIQKELGTKFLEFKIRVYLALYHLRSDVVSVRGLDPAEVQYMAQYRMKTLREYLDAENRELSSIPEALPLFALPFIANAESHPSFQNIFKRDWLVSLQIELDNLLSSALEHVKQPELARMYRKQLGASDGAVDPAIEAAVFDNAKDIFSLAVELLQKLSKVRKDPATLPTKEFLYDMKRKIDYAGENLIKAARKVDLVAPFLKRTPILSPMGSPTSPDRVPHIPKIGDNSSHKGEGASLVSQTLAETSFPLEIELPEQSSPKAIIRYDSDRLILPPLDYNTIKTDLKAWGGAACIENPVATTNCCTLLQALRWRISRSPPGQTRHHVVEVYAGKDILGCEAAASGAIGTEGDSNGDAVGLVDTLLGASHNIVQEYSVRLIAWIARSALGRSYLLRHPTLLSILSELAQQEMEGGLEAKDGGGNMDKNSELEWFSLEALAYLSTRTSCQNFLVRGGCAGWCVRMMESSLNQDDLRDTHRESAAAVFMNICLLPRGRKAVTALAKDSVLEVLLNGMNHSSLKVQTCLYGALYSLLRVPAFKSHCQNSELDPFLNEVVRHPSSDSRIRRQAQFILEALHDESKSQSEAKGSDQESDNDNSDSGQGDETDEEADESAEPERDWEEHPSMRRQELEKSQIITGEAFLRKAYPIGTSSPDESKIKDPDLRSPSGRPKVELPEELRSKPRIPRTPPGDNGDHSRSVGLSSPQRDFQTQHVFESKQGPGEQQVRESFGEMVNDVIGADEQFGV